MSKRDCRAHEAPCMICRHCGQPLYLHKFVKQSDGHFYCYECPVDDTSDENNEPHCYEKGQE